jgi:two-component system, LytTR family, response regulator
VIADSKRVVRAAIVDDEPLARARLRRLLGAEPDVDIVVECARGGEVVVAVTRARPDVVFLDIQMPDIDGFTTIAALPAHPRPWVVFVTAYSEHAIRAFEAQALDYLLKPVSADRLREAVTRVRERLADAQARALESRLASAHIVPRDYPSRLPVPVGARTRLVPVDAIDFIAAAANYTELHIGGVAYVLRETMTHLETRLDPRLFLRIHRSRIVRLACVEDVEPLASGQYVVRLRNGVRMTSGRSYRTRLQQALGLMDESSRGR